MIARWAAPQERSRWGVLNSEIQRFSRQQNTQVHSVHLCWWTIGHSGCHVCLQLSVRVPRVAIGFLRVWGPRMFLVHILGHLDTRRSRATYKRRRKSIYSGWEKIFLLLTNLNDLSHFPLTVDVSGRQWNRKTQIHPLGEHPLLPSSLGHSSFPCRHEFWILCSPHRTTHISQGKLSY